jgi:hypothetical protein
MVLAMVAVAEGRQVDAVMVSFWLNTLAVHGITSDEFRRAVVVHYASSTYPIRPGHVWQIVQRERDWAKAQGLANDTVERIARIEIGSASLVGGDWTVYDQRFPGERKARAEKDLAWWIEHPQHNPTSQVIESLAGFGLTIPDRCPSIDCIEYAVDSGEGRFCTECQGYEGTCVEDHCLTCGGRT